MTISPGASAQAQATSAAVTSSQSGVTASAQDTSRQDPDLPVSLSRIKSALTDEREPLRGLNEPATFKVEIRERAHIKLEDLVNSLDFRSGPVPAGGLYGEEMQRQMWPAVDNPLRQPYSAFNQPELLTILVENLAGHYLAGKVGSAITSAERAHAEAMAREEVARAVTDYCVAQPRNGAGLQICANPTAPR